MPGLRLHEHRRHPAAAVSVDAVCRNPGRNGPTMPAFVYAVRVYRPNFDGSSGAPVAGWQTTIESSARCRDRR